MFTYLNFLFLSFYRVPNAVDGHDSPELEIYGMDGVPLEDLQRHHDGLPLLPYTKSRLIIGDSSILPILAAQKASVAMQLAESKNMTVQGDIGVSGAGTVGAGALGAASATVPIISSSAMSVVSPPVPSSTTASSSSVQMNSTAAAHPTQSYWPYTMPHQYYQPATTVPAANPATAFSQNQYAAAYAQYYQAYYAAQAQAQGQATAPVSSSYGAETQTPAEAVEPEKKSESEAPIEFLEPLIIPPYIDPNTNKAIPGTIFTVPSLDRSLEEIRSELKKYKK